MLPHALWRRAIRLFTVPELHNIHPHAHPRPFPISVVFRMASHEGTTLKQNIPRQEQDLPGLQKEMAPEPFDTSLETGHGPTEYKGSGRLRGKAALITGGECVRGKLDCCLVVDSYPIAPV